MTIGVAYLKKEYKGPNDNEVTFLFWDTGGEERFRSLTKAYYRDAQGVILVYDITDPETFTNLDYWFSELEDRVQSQDIVLAIVGNKKDEDV